MYVLGGSLGGFWLSVAALGCILGVGGPVVFIEMAYLPAHLSGVPSGGYAYPDLVGALLANVAGWTSLACLFGLAHHLVARKIRRSPKPPDPLDR